MRIEEYFRRVQQIVELCPFVQVSSITYDRRSTYEGFIRGDIDIFVVIDDKDDTQDIDDIWCKRINKVLRPFERDVTVLVYTIKALKNVCNWYVLRLASDGISIYDGGRVKPLFAEILDAAEKAGLEQREMAGTMVWAPKRKIKMGEVFEVSVED